MKVIRTLKNLETTLRHFRQNSALSLGFVPTMGALHQGHVSLMKRAARENDRVVVSIFVNPLQFGPAEDFARYPRTLSEDLKFCRRAGVDFVFAPTAGELFRKKPIQLKAAMSRVLCGSFRPGHFDGVVTIVNHFFRLIRPDRAYFGLKDYQQYRVIEDMTRRLYGDKISIVPVPTLREKDGLAMSSRNRYLSRSERRLAPLIHRILLQTRRQLWKRKGSIKNILKQGVLSLQKKGDFRVQYLELVDAETLKPIFSYGALERRSLLLAVAVYLGASRLIDNLMVCERDSAL